jgi:hypothetical protein
MDDVAMDPEFTAINLVRLVAQDHAGNGPPIDPAVDLVINELLRIGSYNTILALARLPWSAPLEHDEIDGWLVELLEQFEPPPTRPRFTIVKDDDADD